VAFEQIFFTPDEEVLPENGRIVDFLDRAKLGNRIAQIRVAHDISPSELARRSKLTPSLISKYEAGGVAPGRDSLDRLSDALHVTTDYLLGKKPALEDVPTVRVLIRESLEKFLGTETVSPQERAVLERLSESNDSTNIVGDWRPPTTVEGWRCSLAVLRLGIASGALTWRLEDQPTDRFNK